MLEIAVVILIVAVAATLVGRSIYRSLRARTAGCACVDECPLSEACHPETGECAATDNIANSLQRKLESGTRT